MPNVIELREKQQKLVADARALLDQITPDVSEARAKELEAQYDATMAEHDQFEARAQRQEKLDAAQARLEAPAQPDLIVPARRATPDSTLEYGDVFGAYLRHGLEGLEPEARSVMRNGRFTDTENRATTPQSTATTAGGYLVPDGFVAELVKSLKLYGPMLDPGVTRELVTGTGAAISWPTMDDTSNTGALLAENAAVSVLAAAFGQKTLNAYKYTSGAILVSEELLQDSGIDVEGIVRDAMAERIGRIVNAQLTTGTGSSQPSGIVTASTAGKTSASGTAVTMDELIDLEHSVDAAYRSDPSCRFMFNDSTLSVIRKLKDGNSAYIWQPSDARTGAPATLLGHPYAINNDMTSIPGTASAGNKVVLFGAFNRYIVRRAREVAIKRLVERYADYFQVGFLGFARFDGVLLDTAAVKHLVLKST